MPKILWMSPFSLHDSSSGAALNCRYMLSSLVSRGFEVWACSSFIFDAQQAAAQAFGDIKELFKDNDSEIHSFDEQGIHYLYTRVSSCQEADMTLSECQLFYHTFIKALKDFKPDVVMGYGTAPVVMSCFAAAKQQGISTAYMLANGSYYTYLFPNIDLIITDSYAVSKLYAERDEINTVPVGAFFNIQNITAPEHQKRYVTFINPSDYKGVAIFAKLAKLCQERMPEVKFLTVNTHQRFNEVVNKLHIKGDLNNHPYQQNDFPNVFMVDQQVDMRSIYAISAIILVPSLWFEAWGRVASEAVFNNIPVIASNSGGLAEAIGGGGVLIDTPEHCQEDFYSLPTDEEIEPWFNALKVLLAENFDQELETARTRLSQDRAVNRLISALNPLINKSQHQTLDLSELCDQINALQDDDLKDNGL